MMKKLAACSIAALSMAGGLALAATPAEASTFNGCGLPYGGPSLSVTGGPGNGTFTESATLRCDSSKNVTIQARVRKVECGFGFCVDDGYYSLGSVSGWFSAGSPRTGTWSGTGIAYYNYNYYGQVRWSTDGGAHYSGWEQGPVAHLG